jgi:hypothetical protein
MHLTRSQDQKSKTLDEFYAELHQSESHVDREGGGAILDLIARLRALPNDLVVYGLTSHNRLCLLAEDTYQSPWFVIISALDRRNYFIEYLMPKAIAPWKQGAYVRGEARSEDDAVKMIAIAIEQSEGWSAS